MRRFLLLAACLGLFSAGCCCTCHPRLGTGVCDPTLCDDHCCDMSDGSWSPAYRPPGPWFTQSVCKRWCWEKDTSREE